VIFFYGDKYRYTGYPQIRKTSGATTETEWECVASGDRFAIMYFDGRKCGSKETTVVVEHDDDNWEEA
jgi:hypothetical protein